MPKYKVGDKVYSFPEGTPQSEIDAALEEMSSGAPGKPSLLQYLQDFDKNAPGAAVRNANFGLPPTVSMGLPPMNPVHNLAGAIMGGLSSFRTGNPQAAATGAIIGALTNNDPNAPLPMTGIQQGAGEAGAFALLDRFKPGAGRAAQAATAVAGNAAGSIAANAQGQTDQSGLQQILSAIFSGGATAAFGANPRMAAQSPDAGFTGPKQPGIDQYLPEFVNEAAKNKDGFLLSYLRGDDDVVKGTMSGLDDWLNARFGSKQLSKSETLNIFNKALSKVTSANAADRATLQRLVNATGDPNATTESLLGTAFGIPQQGVGPKASTMLEAAATLRSYLQDSPEDYDALIGSWIRQVVVKGALKPTTDEYIGLGMRGVTETAKLPTRNAANTLMPFGEGGQITTKAISSEADYLVDGTAFRQHVLNMGPGIDEVTGIPGTYEAFKDVARMMELLDPVNKPHGLKNKLAHFIGGNVKYNANRLMFFGSQMGFGMAAGGLTGLGMLGGAGLGAGMAGSAIALDQVLMWAAKNPRMAHYMVTGLENGNPELIRAASKSMMSWGQNPEPFTPGEAERRVDPMPTTQSRR